MYTVISSMCLIQNLKYPGKFDQKNYISIKYKHKGFTF